MAHWNGLHSLPRSYWVNGIGLGIAFRLITEITNLAYNNLFFYIIIGITFSVWASVGIWRSSDNYKGSKIWSILAKLAVILNILVWISLLTMIIKVF